jgi:hypothetical protein
MIDLLIFYLHTVAVVYAFSKGWQEEGMVEGVLSVGFIAIIFSTGWAISSLAFSYLISQQGIAVWLNRDTIALLTLTIVELVFYSYYLRKDD